MTTLVRSGASRVPSEWTQRETPPRRIAIVGAGPRGLQCAEALARQLEDPIHHTPLEITFFEPSLTPGAGAVYAPNQPDYLLMNFPAGAIDRSFPNKGHREPLGFLEWLVLESNEAVSTNEFVPRATVGKYLSYRFRQTLAKLAALGVACRVVPHAVTEAAPERGAWRCTADGQTELFDHCVVTIGHGLHWKRKPTTPDLLPAYPTEKNLCENRIPPDASVGVRGFALTCIDACLALTEGRGGRFVSDGRTRLAYRPSGREPARLLPFSGTGRPMQPKPDYDRWPVAGEPLSTWRHFQSKLAGLEHPTQDELLDVIFSAADAALAEYALELGLERPAEGTSRRWYDRHLQPKSPQGLQRSMRRAVRIAAGRRPADAGWAIGEAWRQLYATMVERFSYEQNGEAFWHGLSGFCREMERLAFGPPIENYSKLLALVDCGLVDLRHCGDRSELQDGDQPTLATGDRKTNVECVVDAVLPSGGWTCGNEVAGSLLPESVPFQTTAGGAMKTTPAGEPLSPNGSPIASLHFFGRVAEGWVVGHDTLNRNLHDEIDRWAADLSNNLCEAPA